MKLEDDYYWEIVGEVGYETRIYHDRQAERTIERLEGVISEQDKEISRLKSMSLFQRIFRWEK
tara:strand:- start:1448 stop:1636 length:189 start_codon:yes stop_codon:yes gene_type:complete